MALGSVAAFGSFETLWKFENGWFRAKEDKDAKRV